MRFKAFCCLFVYVPTKQTKAPHRQKTSPQRAKEKPLYNSGRRSEQKKSPGTMPGRWFILCRFLEIPLKVRIACRVFGSKKSISYTQSNYNCDCQNQVANLSQFVLLLLFAFDSLSLFLISFILDSLLKYHSSNLLYCCIQWPQRVAQAFYLCR